MEKMWAWTERITESYRSYGEVIWCVNTTGAPHLVSFNEKTTALRKPSAHLPSPPLHTNRDGVRKLSGKSSLSSAELDGHIYTIRVLLLSIHLKTWQKSCWYNCQNPAALCEMIGITASYEKNPLWRITTLMLWLVILPCQITYLSKQELTTHWFSRFLSPPHSLRLFH